MWRVHRQSLPLPPLPLPLLALSLSYPSPKTPTATPCLFLLDPMFTKVNSQSNPER